jgi:DnaD/phage-associated family protein
MNSFKGFADSSTADIFLPETFFSAVLPQIDSLDELKVCLQGFRLLQTQKKDDAFLTAQLLAEADGTLTNEKITVALAQACQHAIFLQVQYREEELYFLNTPRGRAIQKAAARGLWTPQNGASVAVPAQRPNVFQLYEQNIGPLTPILSQMLEDAENTYPVEWLEEAIKLAVKKNVRNWNYVEAILRSWKEKGRNETDRRNAQEDPRNYIEGDLANYIKH